MRQINLVLNTEDLKEAYEKICNFLQMNFTMMPYSFRQFAYLLGGRSNLVRIDLHRAELEIRKNGKTILNAKLTKKSSGNEGLYRRYGARQTSEILMQELQR